MVKLNEICNQTVKIAKEAGEFIRNEKSNISSENIETKSLHSYVTYVDKNAEKKIVEGLRKILPEAGFITEEGTASEKGKKYNWIVDPLDGTTNFIHGLEPFAVSIALEKNKEIILGVVYEIGKDECFYSYKGSKAYLNSEIINVSDIQNISNSLVATGFPYEDYSQIEQISESLQYFMRNSQGIRRLGSAATDLVYVACGRFDAFYELGLNVWDVAAGAFIVKQAGGKVSDFLMKENYLYSKEIAASNSNVFEEFLGILSDKFK